MSSALRAFLLLIVILVFPASASAVTVHDIIELTRAGLADDIIVELIDADRTVFTLDKEQILELKKAGVSRAVLLKMLRTRRDFTAPPQEAAPAVTEVPNPQPELALTPAKPAEPATTVVVPQIYYYVPYSIWGVPPHAGPRTPPQPVLPGYRGFGRFINDGWVERR
jgi:hypothetical protein